MNVRPSLKPYSTVFSGMILLYLYPLRLYFFFSFLLLIYLTFHIYFSLSSTCSLCHAFFFPLHLIYLTFHIFFSLSSSLCNAFFFPFLLLIYLTFHIFFSFSSLIVQCLRAVSLYRKKKLHPKGYIDYRLGSHTRSSPRMDS